MIETLTEIIPETQGILTTFKDTRGIQVPVVHQRDGEYICFKDDAVIVLNLCGKYVRIGDKRRQIETVEYVTGQDFARIFTRSISFR